MQKHATSKSLSVIIVTYNSAEVIGACLNSIPKWAKVTVVDNASTDDTLQIVKETCPRAHVIANKENLGFGCANNLALEKAKEPFTLLLNPDSVLREGALELLMQVAEEYPEAAIIAPQLYYEDGSLQHSYKTSVFKREKHRATYVEPSGDLCAECLSGAVMLLRMDAMKQVGFFDPKIFLFYEDDDLCLRVRKSGFSLVLTPRAAVVHHMGRSSPPTAEIIFRKNWYMSWSRLYLEKKYKSEALAQYRAVMDVYVYGFKTAGYALMFKKEKMVRSYARAMAALSFFFGVDKPV